MRNCAPYDFFFPLICTSRECVRVCIYIFRCHGPFLFTRNVADGRRSLVRVKVLFLIGPNRHTNSLIPQPPRSDRPPLLLPLAASGEFTTQKPSLQHESWPSLIFFPLLLIPAVGNATICEAHSNADAALQSNHLN